MQQYVDLVKYVLNNGTKRVTRQGGHTIGVFAPPDFIHNMATGFPVLTTKKMAWKMAMQEMLWFISGSTNINDLGIARPLWQPYADIDGYVHGNYGEQWRYWRDGYDEPIDQLKILIRNLRRNPYSRRHVVLAWNPAEIDRIEDKYLPALPELKLAALESLKLPPCHAMFQVYVETNPGGEKYISLKMYQRSADIAVGVPFNIVGYGLLLELLAREIGAIAHRLIISYGDAHIYAEHIEAISTQIRRPCYKLPELRISRRDKTPVTLGVLAPGIPEKPANLFTAKLGNISLENYVSHAGIKYAFLP